MKSGSTEDEIRRILGENMVPHLDKAIKDIILILEDNPDVKAWYADPYPDNTWDTYIHGKAMSEKLTRLVLG